MVATSRGRPRASASMRTKSGRGYWSRACVHQDSTGESERTCRSAAARSNCGTEGTHSNADARRPDRSDPLSEGKLRRTLDSERRRARGSSRTRRRRSLARAPKRTAARTIARSRRSTGELEGRADHARSSRETGTAGTGAEGRGRSRLRPWRDKTEPREGDEAGPKNSATRRRSPQVRSAVDTANRRTDKSHATNRCWSESDGTRAGELRKAQYAWKRRAERAQASQVEGVRAS